MRAPLLFISVSDSKMRKGVKKMSSCRIQLKAEIRFVWDGDEDVPFEREPDCVVEYEGHWKGKKIPTTVKYRPLDFDREHLVSILSHMVDVIDHAENVLIQVPAK